VKGGIFQRKKKVVVLGIFSNSKVGLSSMLEFYKHRKEV
jgi:hypothetical protein